MPTYEQALQNSSADITHMTSPSKSIVGKLKAPAQLLKTSYQPEDGPSRIQTMAYASSLLLSACM